MWRGGEANEIANAVFEKLVTSSSFDLFDCEQRRRLTSLQDVVWIDICSMMAVQQQMLIRVVKLVKRACGMKLVMVLLSYIGLVRKKQ